MVNHELHERDDRYELADVQRTKFLHVRDGQQANNTKNEKTKVRVCFALQDDAD